MLIAAPLIEEADAFDTPYRRARRRHRLADLSAKRLALRARVRDEAIRTRLIDSKTRLTGGGHPRPSARKARGQMAQVIKAGSVSHRGERRHGTLSRARTTAPRLALPWRSRLALRRLIAAADAMRRGAGACSGESPFPT